jgi:hypothetical protein
MGGERLRGQVIGHNEITRVADGRGLYENWRGACGDGGVTVNTYDPVLAKWTQRWVGASSNLWQEGGLKGADMVLSGTAPRPTPPGSRPGPYHLDAAAL